MGGSLLAGYTFQRVRMISQLTSLLRELRQVQAALERKRLPKLPPTLKAVVDLVLDGSVVFERTVTVEGEPDPRTIRALYHKGILVRDARLSTDTAIAYRLAPRFRSEE